MSYIYLWLIINISIINARYIRLSTVNCSELSPIGTSIIQLLDILESSNWEFKFLTQTTIKSYFLLDELKGTIRIKRYLDREDLCRLNLCSCLNDCLIKLEINAISDTYTHILSLPILIYDENDNNCYFLNDIYYFNISENIQLNTRIILPIAYDLDLIPNNIQSYNLLNNNYTEFYFQYHIISLPFIIIIKQLDRELHDIYYLNFCAYEGINEQKRSCCTKIILTITDINDNSPIFQHNQQLPLIINISELTLINTILIQMKAFDPDDGINGQIQYSFSKWTLYDKTINDIFNIISDNGSIILLKELDYEKRNNYELQIQAKDLGPNSIPTYTTVIIQVIDENDCIPEIFIIPSPDIQLINNSIINMYENISLNTSILYLTVSDGDINENGRVTIELICLNSIFKLKKINNNTYILLTNIIFDYEEKFSYTFSLITYDHGQPKNFIRNTFDLYLIDINDCFPYFNNLTNYSFNINENNKENLILHTIETFDLDKNDHIKLYLKFNINEEKKIFYINKQNELIIKKSLDYEYQSSYHFILIAQDSIGHQTSIPINIYLNNLNDNPVKFLLNFTQFIIEENQSIGTFIGQINAQDKDKTNDIIYSIHSNDINYVKNLIELNSNGNLYTKIIFYHKQIEKFQFRIIANDSLYTDIILIEILINNNNNNLLLKTLSPYCFSLNNNNNNNENIYINLESYKNVTYLLKNSSSSDLILLQNGTLIVKSIIKKYLFDIYLQENNSYSIYKNFILSIQFKCEKKFFKQFNQQIIFSCFIYSIIIIIIIIMYFYFQKKNLTSSSSSFSLSFISTPSPQFTAMTIISSSTHKQVKKSSSLSTSSSSTYIKMSRSFEDIII